METVVAPLHYNNAPIVEASIELRIEIKSEDILPALEAVGREVSAQYPRRQYITADRGISIDPPEAGVPFGFGFATEDGKQVILARRDGFSFHRIAPYETWEPFIKEARRTWDIFCAQVVPDGVINRFAVRYINEFTLPYGEPLSTFFNVYPITPNRDELFSDMFMRVEVPIRKPRGTIATVLAPSARRLPEYQKFYVMILDNRLSFDVSSSEDAWNIADDARVLKNNAFISQITTRLKDAIS